MQNASWCRVQGRYLQLWVRCVLSWLCAHGSWSVHITRLDPKISLVNHWAKAVGIPPGRGWELMLLQSEELCAANPDMAVAGKRSPVVGAHCQWYTLSWEVLQPPCEKAWKHVPTFLCHVTLSMCSKCFPVFCPLG